MQSHEKITVSYPFKKCVLKAKANFNFKCLNHFLNISEDISIIFPLNHSFLKSKEFLWKKPDAMSAQSVFPIIKISLSQPHLYKNVS
jgi:hypothetical protein